MTPNYATHDPKGYMGDPRRGAAMGRSPKGDWTPSAELADEYGALAVRLSDTLRLKDKRPADGWKAHAWETAANSIREEKRDLKVAYDKAVFRESAAYAPTVTLRRVRLDSQGYDSNGTYFGGGVIYWAATDDGEHDRVFNADDRDDAKRQVLAAIPHARFAGN